MSKKIKQNIEDPNDKGNGAKNLLWQIMQERMWHGLKGKSIQSKAGNDKNLMKAGTLSYEITVRYLTNLGYIKVQDEVWQKIEK